MNNTITTEGNNALQDTGQHILTKKVGGTTYQVYASFSKTSTETMDDKILRLIRNDCESLSAD